MYDLNKHYQSNKKEILQSIDKILNKGVLEMGEEVERFEESFSKYCGVKYSITVSSGSMGLLLALKALNLKENDEVITVANSDIPTSHAVSLAGAKIKWIDVREDTFNIDTKLLDKSINKKSKVILPVHLFGNPAEMSNIQLIAKKNNLLVDEDACLATGAEYNKKKIGNI